MIYRLNNGSRTITVNSGGISISNQESGMAAGMTADQLREMSTALLVAAHRVDHHDGAEDLSCPTCREPYSSGHNIGVTHTAPDHQALIYEHQVPTLTYREGHWYDGDRLVADDDTLTRNPEEQLERRLTDYLDALALVRAKQAAHNLARSYAERLDADWDTLPHDTRALLDRLAHNLPQDTP